MAKQTSERFEKLKTMREKLCESEKIRLERAAQQVWLLEQVTELKSIADCDSCTVDAIRSKIEEIIKTIGTPGSSK